MALYDRLMGLDLDRPKIPIHVFQSVAAEWARGKLTGVEANAVITAVCGGTGLDAQEQADAQTLVNTVTSIPVNGSAAQIADGRARRALRAQEIDQVLLIAETRPPGYSTAAEVKTKLGV